MRWNYERKEKDITVQMEQGIDKRFNRFVDNRHSWRSGLFTKP